VKIPQHVKRYCRVCNKHTVQKVERIKTSGRRKTSSLKAGSRYRLEKLHYGYGGSPYPKMEHGVKYGAKTTQKIFLRFKCSECGKYNLSNKSIRAKKFEIVK